MSGLFPRSRSAYKRCMRAILAALLLFVSVVTLPSRAHDVLFIGNSFTYGATAPAVEKNGGVPKLFEEIARAKGKQVEATAVTAGGKDWTYHLAQPPTARALAAKVWTWVVLQDYSTRPTHIGNVQGFLQDGETFSDRIAQHSPQAGIVLYATWARPPGVFYQKPPGNGFSGPDQMLAELSQSYAHLADDLAARDKKRPVRVAPVGSAFALVESHDPGIQLDASDHHHTTADGYYEAALVIYETIYHESVQGAPTTFFNGQLTIPNDEAAKLQAAADEATRAVAP
jgi:hypothetical protein